MKNVLLLAPELFVSENGVSRMLRLYLKALCELAHPFGRVDLATLHDTAFDARALRRYSDHRLENWAACERRKLRFARTVLQHARRADQILCGHLDHLPLAALARLRRPRLRYSLVVHGVEGLRRPGLLQRLSLRKTHRVLCVSEFVRREFLKLTGLPPGQVVVLPNALDPDFGRIVHDSEAPVGTNADILTVASLSRKNHYKGVDHLIEAMPQIRLEVPAARLRIVGLGDDTPRLQALAARLRLGDAVRFLGAVSEENLRREFRDCRVFALPSRREGFGLVYLEAMAHGKPCVATRCGGAIEVLSPETAVLAEYANLPALAQACAHALRREWNAQAVIARAESFSYSRFRERLGSILFA